MSALLAWIGRQRRTSTLPHREDRRDPVERTHTVEAARASPRHSDPQSSPDVPLLWTMSSQGSSESDGMDHWKTILPAVVTPEGLKPRRSMQELREELWLGSWSDTASDAADTHSPGSPRRTTTATTTVVSPVAPSHESAVVTAAPLPRSILEERHRVSSQSLWSPPLDTATTVRPTTDHPPLGASFLPPIPSRSWSTTRERDSFDSNGRLVCGTPLGSSTGTGSRHSRPSRVSWSMDTQGGNTSTPVAESPNLIPGHARTAVGQLVGASTVAVTPGGGRAPTSPDRHDEWIMSPPEHSVDAMYSPLQSAPPSARVPPETYDTTQSSPFTSTSTLTMTPRLWNNDHSTRGVAPSWSTVSPLVSSAASTRSWPSALSGASQAVFPLASPIQTVPFDRVPPQELVQTTQTVQHVTGYRWVVTTSSSKASQSSHSQSLSPALKRTIRDVPSAHESHEDKGPDPSTTSTTPWEATSYQRSKRRSQQRTKEELIMAALERLQDDIPLVQQVEGLLVPLTSAVATVASENCMFDWYVPTPMNQEGILTGFSEANRYVLLERLEALLAHVPRQQGGSREDVRHALKFCKVLIQMAIPASEKEDDGGFLQGTDEVGRWRFLPELRPAIGLVATDALVSTPQARGGDSSFFSLPHDEQSCTPMTSNVSIGASTLTTAVPRVSDSSWTERHQRIVEQNGLCLRQAIQLLCTGLQTLTMVCAPLLSNEESIDTDRIRHAYRQLLSSTSHGDLTSIVDAFEFEHDTDSYPLLHVIDSTDDEKDDAAVVIAKEGATHERRAQGSPIVHASSLCHGSTLPPRHTVVIDYTDSEMDRRHVDDPANNDSLEEDDCTLESNTGGSSLTLESICESQRAAVAANTSKLWPVFRGSVSLDGRQTKGISIHSISSSHTRVTRSKGSERVEL